MLEGVVANLLNRFLGMYVKNFDAKQLNIGIWSGDVKLHNLELRREALDQLRLPLNVVEGHLGQLTLSIPWSNLRGKPVRVDIEDVFLLAAPREDSDYDPEEEERRAHVIKMDKLESAEILRERNTEGMTQEEQRRNQSFTESFMTAIVDNLQISIKNVHVRYEDSIASPGHPFAAGITLKELSAVSTDSEWRPTFIQSTSGTTHKLAVLGALAVYWNTDTELLGTGSGAQYGAQAQGIEHGELMSRLKEGIDLDESNQYILRPVSGRAGLEMDKTGKLDRPRMKTRLLFNELGFVLDSDQYRDTLMLVDLFHYFLRHQEYKKLQPSTTPKEDPRAWFRFAGNAILSKIHDRNRRWTWAYIKERRDDRLSYINLFKKKKREEALSPDQSTELDGLERKYTYEDLRFWRSLARNQLRKENVGVKKPQRTQTWGEWVWGSKKPEDEAEAMTEEQRQELYNAIDWDEKKALAESVDLPRDSVKLQVNSSLRAGSLTLKRDPHGEATEVMKLVFDNFKAKALQRPDSFFLALDLGGLRVYDGTTKGSIFPQIVRVKDAGDHDGDADSIQSQHLDAEEDSDETVVENSLFHLQLEQNPLESDADTAVKVRLKSFEVIYNPTFVVEVARFFKPPERHMESLGALLDSAGATVQEIRQQTRAGLEYALQEHKKVDAQFDLQAPLIIVPESITKESSLCLILDAGHIRVNSELVNRETMMELQSKQKRQYDEEDYRHLEDLLYDKFLIKLDSTQVLIGPGIEATKSQLSTNDPTKDLHIIDRINVDFVLEFCIVPKSTELTRTRVSGHLPELHASMSDKKYKNLMKLIDISIPRFEEATDQPPSKRIAPADKASEKAAANRARSASFQPSTAREIPLVDDESETEDSRKVVITDNKEQTVALHQRDFEFKFTVGTLRGSLFKADPKEEKPDQLLAELVAEGFQLDYYLRPFDMVAEVTLKSLSVDDYIEETPAPEFKQIISSKGFNAEEDKDLFNLKFIRVKPESPEFKSTYEEVNTNLDIAVSTINVVVTRRTLLTLLDFILITFTNPNQPKDVEQMAGNAIKDVEEEQPQEAGKIRIKSNLKSIALILNNDGVRLATLSLNTADVGIFLVGKAMQIQSRIGSLTLIDDVNVGASADSSLRRLLTIEGEDFADFRYQTFDPESSEYPGYDSEVFLRSGSIKIQLLEEPYRKIVNFLVKFGKMQAIFNAARQAAANQATQLQENASRMRLDIVVRTPIVVFPKPLIDDRPRDSITAELGEIYASNTFVPLDDRKDSPAVNVITTGIRNIRLVSDFHFEDGTQEQLEMIQKVNLDFSICYLEHQQDQPRPDIEVEGTMSPIKLRISQAQLKFLLDISKTVPTVFTPDSEQQEFEAMQSLPATSTEHVTQESGIQTALKKTIQSPEIEKDKETWVKLDMIFKVDSIGLELLLATENKPVGQVEEASLSKFSLNDTRVKVRMLSDGALESELLIHSFSIRDSRSQETNKFRKIMSLINTDVQQQFMASVSMSPGPNRHVIAMLTIDSPRIILAFDYLIALQSFASEAFSQGLTPEIEEDVETPEEPEAAFSAAGGYKAPTVGQVQGAAAEKGEMTFSFRADIVDAQVIMIANPTISNTEAIVLGTKQVLFSHQNVSTLQINKVGMFLCRMDKFETSRLRILDDFTLELSIDSRPQDKGSALTSIDVHVEPLVLRLSLRDILLATQIMNKVSEMRTGPPEEEGIEEPKRIKEVKGESTKTKRRLSDRARSTSGATVGNLVPEQRLVPQQPAVIKKEELGAQIDGIRVILIGDLHELPLLDWSVKKFNVDVRDWSSTLNADTTFDTFVNVYNFSKSAWEPLVEPWQLGFHMAKEINPDVLSIDAYSHKNMELTITSATIALASKSFQFLKTDEDVLSKPRGADAPYRIRNYTGFDLRVWADVGTEENGPAAKLSDGEEYPWRFEDPTTMRENLTPEGNAGLVGVKLDGSGFDSINHIPVIREGETLYNLKPKKDKVLHKLLVDVKLGTNNVKYVTFRSPLQLENNTQIPVEMGIFSPDDGHLLKIEKILPGDARPAPVGSAYLHQVVVRPDQGFGYDWSTEQLYWKDLLRRPTRTITCASESGQQSPPFYFQLNASYDKRDPVINVYPHMKIRISAPVEIQNLLPYDFKYRIYDKNTRKDWTNFLRKGGVSPVHVVELSHLLLLSIDMQDSVFRQSEFAIINGSAQDFRREESLSLKDENGVQLKLKLHYYNVPDSGGAFKVSVYSPYLVLNKTGLSMEIQSKGFMQSARSAAGQGINADATAGHAKPYMFSYPTDDQKNRSIIRIGDSHWSKPQSFDAIGSTFEVVVPAKTSRAEFHAGVSVVEGEGKYKLTRVVTITPRFILNNKLNEDLQVREPGTSNVVTMKGGDLVPLHFLRQVPEKQLCLCFPGVNNQWSSPFNIADVGTAHVKLSKASQRQRLIKAEVVTENATIFIHFSMETRHWPFSMRNESDMEFIFYQSNPNVEDEEYDDSNSGWRPIRYRLPPRSIMPYAWDYPAAKSKSLVLNCNGKERHIRLAEIGNLIPMRVPMHPNSSGQKIVDLNIVAEGPTQTLVLSNFKPSRSIYRQQKEQTSQTSLAAGFEVKVESSDITFKAQLRLGGVGISLINQTMKELLYCTFREIEIKLRESKVYQTLDTTIKWIQIDNQLYGGIFPILLYPSVVPKTGKEMEAHPIFHVMVTRVKDDSYGVLYIKYATLLLQQMTLELDEDFVFAMLDFAKVPGASWSIEQDGKLCDEDLDIPEPRYDEVTQDVYFELLHLQPMQVDISFMRTERVNVEDKLQPSNPFMFFVNVMTMSIGNVNDAPVRLNALILENARVSVPLLITNVRKHYTQEFLRQVHIVLGSADFLGNPVGLFNTVSSGVADIFYEPYQGLVTDRPQDLGYGIAKGAGSFVKKSVFGFSDSMAKITGSMSKGLAAATLDQEFQNQRRMSKARNRPKHALYGVTSGGDAFARSIASGIGGLARHPLQGAEKGGFGGFMKGVGVGVLGAVTKPAIGAFDLASNLAEGVRNTTTVFDADGLDRVRLTRFIGMDGIVRPYSQREALGQFWLKTTDDGKFFKEDYIAHLELPGRDMIVMLTYDRIMLVRSNKLRFEWEIKLTDIQTISKERTGMSITLKGGANGPFIPVQDESGRNWLYKQIAIAVNAFNEKYNAKG